MIESYLGCYGRTQEEVQAGLRRLIGEGLSQLNPTFRHQSTLAEISNLTVQALQDLRGGTYRGYINSDQFEGLAAPLRISVMYALGKPTLTEEDKNYIREQQRKQGFHIFRCHPYQASTSPVASGKTSLDAPLGEAAFEEASMELFVFFRTLEEIDAWVKKQNAA